MRRVRRHESSAGRLKQGLNFLRHRFPEVETAYQTLKTINDPALIDEWPAGWCRLSFL
jgi:tRNA-dihydrouridine synthase C